MMWDGGFGTLEVTTGDLTLTARVRLDGEVAHAYAYGRKGMEVQIPLLAPDPFLYGPAQEATVNPPGLGEGLKWNPGVVKDGWIHWGGAVPAARLENAGNAEAWPIFEVQGEFPDGFTLTVDRQTVEYPGQVTKKAPVLVDTASGQVTQRGRDVTHLLIRREWAPIPPRAAVTPRLSPRNKLSEGWAVARWSDTYI